MQYHKMAKHSFESIAILHASDGINQYKLKFREYTTSLTVSLDRTAGCAAEIFLNEGSPKLLNSFSSYFLAIGVPF